MSSDRYPYNGDGDFVDYERPRLPEAEMRERAAAFYDLMAQRRSVRTFSSDTVPGI